MHVARQGRTAVGPRARAGYLRWEEWQKRASVVYVLCCISLLGGFQEETSVDWADEAGGCGCDNQWTCVHV
jgi:hypothetical protein